MSRRRRLVVFLAGAVVLAAVLVWGLLGLPDFGNYRGPYGLVLNEVAVAERHATNVPTVVNFDYRAFDTLGEEFILFAAALGMATLMRERREGEERPPEEEPTERDTSELLRAAGPLMAGGLVLLGIYVVTHGHLTPGGAFQGGVVLGAAFLLAYLVDEYLRLRRMRPWVAVEAVESVGAGGYALIGVAGLVMGVAYFDNFLPYGSTGKLLSGGTVPISNVVVSLEVLAAFTVVFSELAEQALVVRRRR